MTALGTLVEGRPGKVIAAIGTLFAAAYAASLILLPKPDGRIVIGDALHHYVQLRSAVFDGDLHFRNEYVRMYGLRGGEPGTELGLSGDSNGTRSESHARGSCDIVGASLSRRRRRHLVRSLGWAGTTPLMATGGSFRQPLV